MQKDSGFFDDLAKMASGAAGNLLEMKREIEALFTANAEKMVRRMNLVTREEFDAVKQLAARAADDAEQLRAKLSELEAELKKSRGA